MKRETRPTEVNTRRGNRVYRFSFLRDGQRVFAEGYTFRIKKEGVQHYFALGNDLDNAKLMADRISSFLAVPSNTAAALFDHPDFASLKLSRKVLRSRASNNIVPEPRSATVGEFCERYMSITGHLSRFTVLDNINSIRRIAAFAIGLSPMPRNRTKKERLDWREKVHAVRLDKLTTQVLESFRQDMLKSAGGDHLKRAKSITTCNSYIRCAAGMFAPKLLTHYRDFDLPNDLGFRHIRALREPSHRYVSQIDPSALLAKAREELATKQPDVYLILVLALCCGMRRAEIDRLTWEQVDFSAGHIWIKTTPFSRPKARNSESRIDAAPEVVRLLEAHRRRGHPGPFVILGSLNLDVRVRCLPTFSVALDWLRANGVSSTTALHTLRKEAGSLIFQSHGSIDLAAEFLRNDVKVAREHYIGRKQRLELRLTALADAETAAG